MSLLSSWLLAGGHQWPTSEQQVSSQRRECSAVPQLARQLSALPQVFQAQDFHQRAHHAAEHVPLVSECTTSTWQGARGEICPFLLESCPPPWKLVYPACLTFLKHAPIDIVLLHTGSYTTPPDFQNCNFAPPPLENVSG